MWVGVCRLELGLDDNFSLKGKRSVVKRTIQRMRNRFNLAMAEVDDADVHTRAVLGFALFRTAAAYARRSSAEPRSGDPGPSS